MSNPVFSSGQKYVLTAGAMGLKRCPSVPVLLLLFQVCVAASKINFSPAASVRVTAKISHFCCKKPLPNWPVHTYHCVYLKEETK